MNESKPERRWSRFSIRDLLLFTVIAALAAAWWLDHRRLMAVIMSPEPPEYLVDLSISKDGLVEMLVARKFRLETEYAKAKANNDGYAANAAKDQLDEVQSWLDRRRNELHPKVVDELRKNIVQAQQ